MLFMQKFSTVTDTAFCGGIIGSPLQEALGALEPQEPHTLEPQLFEQELFVLPQFKLQPALAAPISFGVRQT